MQENVALMIATIKLDGYAKKKKIITFFPFKFYEIALRSQQINCRA